MRVADYIFSRLADAGLRHVFMVTGGGAMFLNEAIRRERRLRWTCHHHEQAAAMAAEGYARVTGVPAILNVTTGPGGINALNGVFGAWTDSIPMIVVSGQVKRETCMSSYPGLAVRQLGDQEADVVAMASGMTKLALQLTDSAAVRSVTEEAIWLATHERQGPVWLDVPIDVQSSNVDPASLPGFVSPKPNCDRESLRAQVSSVIDHIERAERPVVLVGTGIRLASAQDALLLVIEKLGIPVTTAWTHDTVANDHPLWCGRPGTIGDRAGNFTVQASDLLLVVGSRLNIRQVSYNWTAFAPHAFKIQVDIDSAELAKPTVRPDLPIVADASDFLEELADELSRRGYHAGRHAGWLRWCRERTRRYPVVDARRSTAGPLIDPYRFIDTLFAHLGPRDVVATGNGAACVMTFQAARLKTGQRLFSNSGSASMGYDLPAALGAAVALAEGEQATGQDGLSPRPRAVCIAGDGSLQMNVQELQTLATHQLPVKVFVIDNHGYLSIRSSQDNFFEGRIGESPESGVGLPDWVAVAEAYGIDAVRISDPRDMAEGIAAVLASEGPCLAHVVVDPAQGFEPRVMSRQLPDGRIESPALDDLYPFLSAEEAALNKLREDGTLP